MLPYQSTVSAETIKFSSFGIVLSPVTSSAQIHSTSELLRFL